MIFGIWHLILLIFDIWHLTLLIFDIWHLNLLIFDIWHSTNALCVSQCNYKQWKVSKSKTLLRLDFYWKSFKPFLMKMQNCLTFYTNIWLSKYFGRLFIYLQNTWRAVHINLKFGMWSNQMLLFKKLENNFFIRAALLGANISQIFWQLGSAKIFGLWFRGLCSTGTFPQPGWIATDS